MEGSGCYQNIWIDPDDIQTYRTLLGDYENRKTKANNFIKQYITKREMQKTQNEMSSKTVEGFLSTLLFSFAHDKIVEGKGQDYPSFQKLKERVNHILTSTQKKTEILAKWSEKEINDFKQYVEKIIPYFNQLKKTSEKPLKKPLKKTSEKTLKKPLKKKLI